MKTFSKPALSIPDQVCLLEQRGLRFADKGRAERHLQHISYFRLSGYFRHFMRDERFLPDTTYDDVWELYKFDRRLRLHTLDAIERIEVSIRTTISNALCQKYGSHWYDKQNAFKNIEDCQKFQEQIIKATNKHDPKKQTDATRHYYLSYDAPPLPPSWVVMEDLSMGQWSKAFSTLKINERKAIAKVFALPENVFTSWVASLSIIRNICAHHGRLWNRKNFRRPQIPHPVKCYCPDFTGVEYSYYATTCIAFYFLKKIVRRSTWVHRLATLFQEFQSIQVGSMGFPSDWSKNPFWSTDLS